MLNGLGPEHCRLFMCYVDEDGKQIPLSGAVTTQYAGKTCYVYGASATTETSTLTISCSGR